MKLSTMPKPKIDHRLSEMIVQCNQLVNLAEIEGDLKLMIQAMATRTELLRQAIKESTK